MFVILVFIYILLFVYFTGFGLSRLILPKKLADAELLLMPFIGLAFTITVIQNLNYFVPVNQAIWTLLTISFVLAAVSFIKHKRLTLLYKEDWRLSLVFLFASIVALYPLLRLGYPTTRSISNNDGFWFTMTAKWFQQQTHSTIPEISHLTPLFTNVNTALSTKMRIGIDLFLAAVSSAFNLDPYQVFSVLIAFLFAIIPVAVYLLLSVFFKLPKKLGLLAALIVAVNNGALRSAFEGNLAQLAGQCFLILSIGAIFYALFNPDFKSRILAALMIVGLVSTYLEMIPFLVLPIFLFLIYAAAKKQLAISSIFSTIIFVTCSVIVLNIDAFIRMVIFLETASTIQKGLIYPWMLTPTQSLLNIFGLVHLWNGLDFMQFQPLLRYLLLALVFLSVLLGLYGLIKKNDDNNARFLLLAALVSYLGIAYRMRYIQEFGYGFYKALVASQFVFLIFLSIGIYYFWNISKSKMSKSMVLLFLLPFIVVNIYNERDLSAHSLNSPLVVDEKYITLSQIKEVIPAGSVIFLEKTNSPYRRAHDEHYTVYFLNQFAKMETSFYSHQDDYFLDRKIITGENRSDYFYQADYSHVLIPGEKDVVSINDEPLWSNGHFYLYERPRIHLVLPGKGWSYVEDMNGSASRWTENEAELFVNSEVSKKTGITFEALVPQGNKKTIDLFLNEELIQTFHVTDKLKEQVSNKFQVDKGRSILKFVVSADSENINDEDPRELGVALQNISLF